jgi:hypothetical protein
VVPTCDIAEPATQNEQDRIRLGFRHGPVDDRPDPAAMPNEQRR